MAYATYALVYYKPNPMTGERLLLGALVFDGEIMHTLTRPTPEGYLTPKQCALFRALCDTLEGHDSIFSLPDTMGPHATRSASLRDTPDTDDPVQWVRENIIKLEDDQ